VRVSTGIYIAVIAAAIGLATVTTRIISPNNNFLASLLDVLFVAVGVLALEAFAYRRRRRRDSTERGTPTFLFTDVEGSTALGTKPFPAANAFGDIWVPSAGGTDVVRVHIR
jgi:purine-cytosine permease-like protein